jgi:hypothetical protein
MTRYFINAVKNFREENGVVKFDVGEEFINDRGVGFNLTSQLCMARNEFCGMVEYLQKQARQLTPLEDAPASDSITVQAEHQEEEPAEDASSSRRIKVN